MRYFRDQSRRPQQPSTHTYRLSKFLKNRCVAAAKKRDYVEPTSPCQASRESFLRRPGKHQNNQTPKPLTASLFPAPLRLRSSTAALEEVRIIDTQTGTSRTKYRKALRAACRRQRGAWDRSPDTTLPVTSVSSGRPQETRAGAAPHSRLSTRQSKPQHRGHPAMALSTCRGQRRSFRSGCSRR